MGNRNVFYQGGSVFRTSFLFDDIDLSIKD